MTNLIETAKKFATQAHKGQYRKDPSKRNYIVHVEEVVKIVRDHGGSDIAISAAWLHDVVEDCPPISIQDIVDSFGADVAKIVAEVTDDKSLPKAERKKQQILTAPHKSFEACLIKIADKISIVRELTQYPPAYWGKERRVGYVDWARQVVLAMAHQPESMIIEFDEIYTKARQQLMSDENLK
jgi:(p)ppGpp synthase/HD superfamily hydrolase